MKKSLPALWLTSLLTLGASAWAQSVVSVENAWVRGTVASQKGSGAFMTLTASKAVRLVGVQSSVAGVTEIHEMAMDQDIMVMRETTGIQLVPGRPVELRPGGYHIMLMDLKQPLKAGESVALTLSFEDSARKRFTQEVKAAVVPLGAQPPASMHQPRGAGHKH